MIVMIPGSFSIFIGQNLKAQNTLVFRDFWHIIICVHVHVYVHFHVNGLYVEVRGLCTIWLPLPCRFCGSAQVGYQALVASVFTLLNHLTVPTF